MNRLELRNESRRLMAEKSSTMSYADNEDLNKWINEGMKDMCVKGKLYERSDTLSVTNGIASYIMPWDFVDMKALLNNYGVALDSTNPIAAGKVFIVIGKPLYYYITQSLITSTIREPSTTYAKGIFLTHPSPNGYMYEVTTSGTTQVGAPPTYPTDEGQVVADGTCTLTCREYMTRVWSITLLDTPTTSGGGTGTYTPIFYAIAQGLANDTDSPPFPVDKHHILPIFVCFRWAAKSKDSILAQLFYIDYAKSLGLDITDITGAKSAT